MDLRNFKAGNCRKSGNYKTLSPVKINRPWTCCDPYVHVLLEEASRSLGELNAFSRIIPNVDLFIKMHVVKEATQSSRIEGTKTQIIEALMDKDSLAPEKQDDWQEVQNYIAATGKAISLLRKLPVCSRLIKTVHQELMRGVRGEGKAPGQFRKVQNWIGGRNAKEAVYVPPEPQEVPDLMNDLEKFLNNVEIEIPHLLRIAMAHYQFETIHPFLDGNGRTGRLLIVLYLIQTGLLQQPTLYLSDYLEQKRRDYFESLSGVRSSGGMLQWFVFFLGAVIETAKTGCRTFNRILELRSEVDDEIRQAGAKGTSVNVLFRSLFQNPVLEMTNQVQLKNITNRTLRRMVDLYVERGLLVELTGKPRNRTFAFKKYIELFKTPG